MNHEVTFDTDCTLFSFQMASLLDCLCDCVCSTSAISVCRAVETLYTSCCALHCWCYRGPCSPHVRQADSQREITSHHCYIVMNDNSLTLRWTLTMSLEVLSPHPPLPPHPAVHGLTTVAVWSWVAKEPITQRPGIQDLVPWVWMFHLFARRAVRGLFVWFWFGLVFFSWLV